jgi:hypothetical protein
VNHHGHLSLVDAEFAGRLLVKHLGHFLDFEEVITGPECPELGHAALQGSR